MIDALDEAVAKPERLFPSRPQLALPATHFASVIIGARNEKQLRQNLGAVERNFPPAQVASLDAASATQLAYPYWHQRGFAGRNPSPV